MRYCKEIKVIYCQFTLRQMERVKKKKKEKSIEWRLQSQLVVQTCLQERHKVELPVQHWPCENCLRACVSE